MFCDDCLVFAFGPHRPPMCVECALAAAGIRSRKSSLPKLRRSTISARRKKPMVERPVAPEPTPVASTPTAEELWLDDASHEVPGGWRQVF